MNQKKEIEVLLTAQEQAADVKTTSVCNAILCMGEWAAIKTMPLQNKLTDAKKALMEISALAAGDVSITNTNAIASKATEILNSLQQ